MLIMDLLAGISPFIFYSQEVCYIIKDLLRLKIKKIKNQVSGIIKIHNKIELIVLKKKKNYMYT